MSEITDPKLILINVLETEFSNEQYPIYLQGSMSISDAYPPSFFTYFNNNSEDDGFYDNDNTKVIWDFDLNFYSTDPVLVNTELLRAKTACKRNGFIVTSGDGYDVISDEPTHTGRGMNLIYVKRKETN